MSSSDETSSAVPEAIVEAHPAPLLGALPVHANGSDSVVAARAAPGDNVAGVKHIPTVDHTRVQAESRRDASVGDTSVRDTSVRDVASAEDNIKTKDDAGGTEAGAGSVAGATERKEAKKSEKKKKKKKKKDKSEAKKVLAKVDKAPVDLEKARGKVIDEQLRTELQLSATELQALKKKFKKAEAFPERGIETWFRLASRNLYTRRQIVDTKANLLITINSLILSVVLTVAYRLLSEDPYFAVAIAPLITSSLLSIFFSVFATKPRMIGQPLARKTTWSAEDCDPDKVSLMTFDEFYKMPESEYEVAVGRLVSDRDSLYGSIKRDIHRLGMDLKERYRYLEHSFGTFLLGITLSTILFVALHL